MNISHLCSFVGYEITEDYKNSNNEFCLELKKNSTDSPLCSKCGNALGQKRGRYRLRIKHLPVFQHPCYLLLWRNKHDCLVCKKIRSEKILILSDQSPHLSKAYVYWLAKICEISTVAETAELTGNDDSTLWRIDKKRLDCLFSKYKIPDVEKISVDEVASRKKPAHKDESRNERFFTIITDLKTKKVIWVSDSRNKRALDEFFIKLGKDRCKKIKVVATDNHKGYGSSIQEHCPRAIHVLDKFHIVRRFEDAVDSTRKQILRMLRLNPKLRKLASGRKRFIFMKRSSQRNDREKSLMEEVMKENELFYKLELIKERFLNAFDRGNTMQTAKQIILEIRDWIWECGFIYLKRWYKNFVGDWPKIKNYFLTNITTSISEGFNNVIKRLRRMAYGYRNMDYFKLKIMQKCGYLHSRYIKLKTIPGI